jgi:hypothetical protein
VGPTNWFCWNIVVRTQVFNFRVRLWRVSGFSTTGCKFLELHAGPRTVAQMGYTGIYIGSSLQRVTPYVQFTLLCYLHLSETQKTGWGPQTQVKFDSWANMWKCSRTRRQGISESLYSHQKLWIILHVPLSPSFIGRQTDFYIPRLPLNLKNIPNVNMYMNVFWIPWFEGLISHIYKPDTCSHLKPGLLGQRPWLQPFIHENSQSQRSSNWASESTAKEKFLKISEVSIFTIPRTRQVPAVLKREADLW